MALGVEIRVPYLSNEVTSAALKIPSDIHLNPNRKSVLLSAYKKELIPQVYDSPKRGFNLELTDWIKNNKRFNPNNIYQYLKHLGIKRRSLYLSWIVFLIDPRKYVYYWRWIIIAEFSKKYCH